MLLRDRIHTDYFQRGGCSGNKQNKRDKEPCRRFNKGKCSYGLACIFDHRCSVKKCGKFSHGAHVCHLRGSQDSDTGKNESGTSSNREDKKQ